jgi:hypothetical protein
MPVAFDGLSLEGRLSLPCMQLIEVNAIFRGHGNEGGSSMTILLDAKFRQAGGEVYNRLRSCFLSRYATVPRNSRKYLPSSVKVSL